MAILAGQRIRALDFAGYASDFDFSNLTGLAPAGGQFEPGSPIFGVAFMAPSSGAVKCDFGGRLRVTSGAVRGVLACQLRTGAVINSGVLVEDADADRGVEMGATNGGEASSYRVHTGLTPGDLYHFVMVHSRASTGGTIDVIARYIAVSPWHE